MYVVKVIVLCFRWTMKKKEKEEKDVDDDKCKEKDAKNRLYISKNLEPTILSGLRSAYRYYKRYRRKCKKSDLGEGRTLDLAINSRTP